MNQFLVLLKVSIQSMLLSSTNSKGRDKKKAATGMGAVIIIAFLGLYLSGLYSYMLMKALAPSHMEVLVFIFMGIAALVGRLLFTTFAVKGVVFGGKDNDLLLSMPVSSTTLMASRVIAILVFATPLMNNDKQSGGDITVEQVYFLTQEEELYVKLVEW